MALFLSTTVFLYSEYHAAQAGGNVDNRDRGSKKSIRQVSLTPLERSWLSKHKTIRVAGPRSFPPFHYYDSDGLLKGMASDYLKFIIAQLNINAKIDANLPWPEVLKRAQQKGIDVILCAAKSTERETYLSFSTPYLSFPFVIITQKDGPFISGIDDLHGKRVSFTKKVVTQDWLKQDEIAIIPHAVNNPLEALKAVSVGEAEAYIGNLAAVTYMIEKNGLANLKIAAPTKYGNYNLHFAVRKDWPQLVSIINKALFSMTPEQ